MSVENHFVYYLHYSNLSCRFMYLGSCSRYNLTLSFHISLSLVTHPHRDIATKVAKANNNVSYNITRLINVPSVVLCDALLRSLRSWNDDCETKMVEG